MKILLATDGTEYSEEAAKFLTRFNFTPDDEIIILHAVSWVPIMREWESLYEDFKKIREEIVPKIIDSAADILRPLKAKITTSFAEDYPDRAIVETASGSGVDLIVMGSKGMRGIITHLVGSVTKVVATKSSGPVLIIKPSHGTISGGIRVLFATDGSEYSDAAGKILSALPFPDDTEVSVLNVIFPALSDIPERFSLEIDDRIKNIVASTREWEARESEKIVNRSYEQLRYKFSKIDKLTRYGDPPVEIVNTAEKLQADIIAVGSKGMRGIKKMLGSVSRYVLNHSKCSVLIGKT